MITNFSHQNEYIQTMTYSTVKRGGFSKGKLLHVATLPDNPGHPRQTINIMCHMCHYVSIITDITNLTESCWQRQRSSFHIQTKNESPLSHVLIYSLTLSVEPVQQVTREINQNSKHFKGTRSDVAPLCVCVIICFACNIL